MNDLMLPGGTSLLAMFRDPEVVDQNVRRIEEMVRSHVADVTTAKGRDAIASLAFRVSKSKVYLDGEGKKLTEEAKREIGIVDAARKVIRDRLDALRDEARLPLTEWEAEEEERVIRIKATIAALINHGMTGEEASADIVARAESIKSVVIGPEFGDFEPQATAARDATLQSLRIMYSAAKLREDQAAELEALRAEKAVRDEADRVAREAKDQADAERAMAERAEADRIAKAQADAARQKQIEVEMQAAADLAAKQAMERAAEDAAKVARDTEARIAAIQRQKDADDAAHVKEIADAKAREQHAAQAERDRIAAQAEREQIARIRRAADEAHRNGILSDIAAALRTMDGASTPELIAEALLDGRIPHITVNI